MTENISGVGAGAGDVAELRALVAELTNRLDATSNSLLKATARLNQAEKELSDLRKRVDAGIPEDTVIAISAAVSAYLGNKGKVRAIRYNRHKTWAAQGRQVQQQHLR
ncbi:hypothetical protein [Corynebacterium lactis]|uniref:Methylmalonyl-CoA carboxyltransferase n=1 Tax=Corynebacterium lactis RW2-5 TaxID=1408189 RepID=A0A0K2H0M7_9CORY|nr:hypothetical protein [Corynebacterium lactis]ALA67607.1 methylmalonyl-CoA carboxyltransferase [Corynebacterium lactis RW2-5]